MSLVVLLICSNLIVLFLSCFQQLIDDDDDEYRIVYWSLVREMFSQNWLSGYG